MARLIIYTYGQYNLCVLSNSILCGIPADVGGRAGRAGRARHERAEVSARVAHAQRGLAAELRLPQQRKVHACIYI